MSFWDLVHDQASGTVLCIFRAARYRIDMLGEDGVPAIVYTLIAAFAALVLIRYSKTTSPSELLASMGGFALGSLSHVLPHRFHTLSNTSKTLLKSLRPSNLGASLNMRNTEAPPGLGNWDNSCYQNAILQCLASLQPVREYIRRVSKEFELTDENSLNGTLMALLESLNDPQSNGKVRWTPQMLKTMDSVHPQDAHEYFSLMMELGEKEIVRLLKKRMQTHNVEYRDDSEEPSSSADSKCADEATQQEVADKSGRPKDIMYQNPLDGLAADRTVCVQCGYSEGLRLVDFNCLMTQFPKLMLYPFCSLEDLLDEYVKREEVGPTYCAYCTSSKSRDTLKGILGMSAVNPAHVEEYKARLATVEELLITKDFGPDDSYLLTKAKIPKTRWAETMKRKQTVIARAPQCLAVNINRNDFDETTFQMRKNTTRVKIPSQLDLSPWVLEGTGLSYEQDPQSAAKDCQVPPLDSMCSSSAIYEDEDDDNDPVQPVVYRLRAVVTHKGWGYQNGHYICYKRYPLPPNRTKSSTDGDEWLKPLLTSAASEEQWWELSDEDVRLSSQDFVANSTDGAFMLFYERDETAFQESSLPTPIAVESMEEVVIHVDEIRHDDVVAISDVLYDKTMDEIESNDAAATSDVVQDERMDEIESSDAATTSDVIQDKTMEEDIATPSKAATDQTGSFSTDDISEGLLTPPTEPDNQDIPAQAFEPTTPEHPVVMRTAGTSVRSPQVYDSPKVVAPT